MMVGVSLSSLSNSGTSSSSSSSKYPPNTCRVVSFRKIFTTLNFGFSSELLPTYLDTVVCFNLPLHPEKLEVRKSFLDSKYLLKSLPAQYLFHRVFEHVIFHQLPPKKSEIFNIYINNFSFFELYGHYANMPYLYLATWVGSSYFTSLGHPPSRWFIPLWQYIVFSKI